MKKNDLADVKGMWRVKIEQGVMVWNVQDFDCTVQLSIGAHKS